MLRSVLVARLAAMGCVACAAGGGRTTDRALTADGELRTAGEIRFRVRPLMGPGSKGPHEISPESRPVLDEVGAFLAARADLALRIECSVNPMLMGRTPEASWGAELAGLVARELVERGVDCRRLQPVGALDSRPGAPAERVRFFVPGHGRARPAGAAADACAR